MITLKDFLELIDFRVTEGYEFQWACFGSKAWTYEYNDPNNINTTISVVFDSVSQRIYEVEAWDGKNNRQYRWIHPNYVEAYKNESAQRGVDFKKSIDSASFVDLETEDDIKEKARAIFLSEDYDTRVILPLDLSKDEAYYLMEQAHKADMTLNDYVAYILKVEIEKTLSGM